MVFCLGGCGPTSAVLSVWEYRISNPLRTRSQVDVQSSGRRSSLGCYVHLSTLFWRSIPELGVYSGTWFRFWIQGYAVYFWVPTFLLCYQYFQFRLKFQNYVNRSLIPDIGIRRQPLEVQLLFLCTYNPKLKFITLVLLLNSGRLPFAEFPEIMLISLNQYSDVILESFYFFLGLIFVKYPLLLISLGGAVLNEYSIMSGASMSWDPMMLGSA